MKYFLVLLVIFFGFSDVFSQENAQNGDNKRLDVNVALSSLQKNVFTDSLQCQATVDELVGMLSSSSQHPRAAEIYLGIADFFALHGQWALTEEYAKNAAIQTDFDTNKDFKWRSLLLLGQVKAARGDYRGALTDWEEVLKLGKEQELPKAEAEAYWTMALFFAQSESLVLAQKYAEKAYAIFSKLDQNENLVRSYLMLAFLAEMDFDETGNHEKILLAMEHLKASELLANSLKNTTILARFYARKASIALKLQQSDEAMKWALLAQKFMDNTQSLTAQAEVNFALGYVFVFNHSYTAADRYLTEAMELSARRNNLLLSKKIMLLRVEILEQQEIYQEALFVHKKMVRTEKELTLQRQRKEYIYNELMAKENAGAKVVVSKNTINLALAIFMGVVILALVVQLFLMRKHINTLKANVLQRKIRNRQLANELDHFKREALQFEQSLRLAEANYLKLDTQYHYLAYHFKGMVIVVDSEGIITYVSPSVTPYMGFEAHDFIGRPIDKSQHYFIQEVNRLVWQHVVHALLEEQQLSDIEMVSKDGYEHNFRVQKIHNTTDDGLLFETVLVLHDVNELIDAHDEMVKFNIIMEQTPASIVITNRFAEIEYVNPHFTHLTGYTLDEVKGKNPRVLKSPHKRKEDYTALWRAIASGKTWQGEFENVKKNGETYWELASIAPIRNSHRETTHYIAVKEDITEHKELLRVLQESEQLYSSLIQTSPDGMALIQTDGHINFASAKLLEMYAIGKSNEIIGSHFSNWVDASFEVQFQLHFEKALAMHETGNEEFLLCRRDGQKFWGEINTSALRDSNGKPIGLVSVQRDISQRKRIENELTANRLLVNKIINTIPAFIAYINTDGYFQLANSRFEDIFGVTLPRPVKGSHFSQIMPLYMLTRHKLLTDKCKEHGSIEYFEETLPTGQHINQSICGLYSPFYTNNVLTGIVMVVLDMTNQKQIEHKLAESEQRLRESNELKDKMFSIIAHDLRGPIGTLASTLDLMLDEDDYFDDKSRTRMLTLLKQSSGSVLNLLENLLTWAQSQRSNLNFFPNTVQIAMLVYENFSLLSSSADKKQITLYNSVHEQATAYIDRNLITAVLRNLISNAIKFTGNGGWVKVSAEDAGDYLEITVADNGVGLSQESVLKIMTGRSHYSTYGTNNEKGSGLGLMLCQELIQKNNGQLRIESQPGEGSRFIFTLPKHADA